MTAPDVVYRNGRVFTANPAAPWASAIALAGDRIVAVGADDAARLEAAKTVDLGGALVLPGVTDAHFHTLMTGDA
ncbi:MAG: amidohydrolase, partial [Actinomycetota bacterium]